MSGITVERKKRELEKVVELLKERANERLMCDMLSKVRDFSDIMRYLRLTSFDLPSALGMLSVHLSGLDKNVLEHGSLQDLTTRRAVQLAKIYDVDLDCFYEWET